MLISFGLRHLEDQPVAVHLCGHHPDAGANPRIRSNPYTISMDATGRDADEGEEVRGLALVAAVEAAASGKPGDRWRAMRGVMFRERSHRRRWS
ncbi:hypothetical protein [Streptomyces sp. NPDC002078]